MRGLKSSLKVVCVIFALFVFICPPLVLIAQYTTPVIIATDIPQLGTIRIQPQPDGKVVVDVGDFPQGGRPGDPALPYKLVSLLVPPDTDLAAVQANLISGDWQELDGEHDVAPVPPAATWDGEKFIVDWGDKNENDIVDGQDTAVYGQDAYFPAEPAEIVSVGEFRQWKLVEYKVWLAAYNPVQKKVRVLNNAQAELSVPKLSDAQAAEPACSDSFVPELLNKIDNPEDLEPFYGEAGGSEAQPALIPADYVIITTSTIVANSTKLANFIIAKQALGFTVKTVTESALAADDTHYLTGANCNARADNIRSWLKNNWASDGIKYVLLIGDPHPSTFSATTSIPMKMCWPRSTKTTYKSAPSDMYFAELSNTWNLDGDGMFGEFVGDYGAGGCDKNCEVKLGRIPFYGSYVDLDAILQKSINYGSATGNLAWRKKVLIPAAVSNFGPQDNNGDGDASDSGDYPNSSYRTFGDNWGQNVKSVASTNSYSSYTLYEKNGVYAGGSAYPLTACNAALTNANFISEWQKAYGFVTWWGHGGQTSASRFRWTSDSSYVNIMGNKSPHYEAAWTNFVSIADCASLDDTKPSFVVQVSCLNGYPENVNNLGYRLLKQGAIGTVSGTRVTWYAIGSWATTHGGNYGDNASYGYRCFDRMSGSNETIGEALVYCKANFGTGWASGSSWMNMVDISLYGDPSLGLGVVGGGPKWEQLPDKTENGMDLRIDREDGVSRVLADDFLCTQTGAITDVVFWGSWLGDQKCPIKKIHLSIHNDKPDPDGQGSAYSEPNNLLWSRDFVTADINETLYYPSSDPEWFWDPAGGMAPIFPGDYLIWQYHIHIGSNQFIQQGEPNKPLVYWLDIYAELDKAPGDQNDYQFGWKTSKDHWNDDAVWSLDDGLWNELRYPIGVGHPLEEESIDLSFRIATGEANEPNYIKWSQPPVPWVEEGVYVGWDEEAHDLMQPPTMVADDFLCDSNKPITGIRWWGSFLGWQSPTIPPPHMLPDKFLLTIWTDVPAGVDATYSHPNEVIWGNMCDTYTVDFYGYEFDPRNGTQDLAKFEFYQELDPCDYWQQPNDVNVYWLGIMAMYGDIPGGGDPCYPWGWETREHYYNDDAVRFIGGIPDMCTPYPPEDFEPIEWDGNSWDVSFELITNPKVPPKPPTPNLKWSQPPIEIDPTASSPTYLGWDEMSYNKDEEQHPTEPWRIVADDFRCLGAIPITSVHWWGSHVDWEEPNHMPAVQPIDWHIGFWSNVPAGVAADYSYPEILLHQFTVDANRVVIEQVATDYYHGEYPNDVCYQYYVDLAEDEVFWQEDYNDQTQDHVYWLSITAVYDDACAPPVHPWGWKTRPWSWMDDAVIFNISEMPVDGMQLDPLSITPLKDPIFYESFDVSFELDTDPNYIKWQQPYDSIRHWSHYEDEKSMAITETETTDPVTKWIQSPDLSTDGMDVNATEPYILADDYPCTLTGPITDITVWGSWRNDELPFDDENAVTFVLSIHSDNPAGPMGWSEPQDPLWIKAFMPGEFTANPTTTNGEGWYDPNEDRYIFPGDWTCWRYDFHIDANEAFVQQGTTTEPIIYWLDVQAIPDDPNAKFGWKTSDYHWNDDAVWGWGYEAEPNLGEGIPGLQPYYGPWYELRYPFDHPFAGQSIDLAFEIKGSEQITQEPNIIRLVADDWKCQGQTPITAVVFWGSYLNYGYEAGNITGPWMQLPVKPDYFLLNIWDDVPASASSTGYSHPNDVLWEYKAYAYDEVLVGYDKKPHGEPNEPVFRYSVRLPEDDWFCQEEVNDIYWLSVVAVYEQSIPNYDWGWTNHEHVFNDDAVAGTKTGGASPVWEWEELYDQTQKSEDMSFMLFTEPGCFPCCHPDYSVWRSVGKPDCWCYPRQCHGDADNRSQGKGNYWTSTWDLDVLIGAWNKNYTAIAGQTVLTGGGDNIPMICADFDHKEQGKGNYRVSTWDLNILVANWNIPNKPDPNCLDCP